MAKAIQAFYNKKESDDQVFLDGYLLSVGAVESRVDSIGETKAVRYDTYTLEVDIEEVIDTIRNEFPKMEIDIEEGENDDLEQDVEFTLVIRE